LHGADVSQFLTWTGTPNSVYVHYLILALFVAVWGNYCLVRYMNGVSFDGYNVTKTLIHFVIGYCFFQIAAPIVNKTQGNQQVIGVLLIFANAVGYMYYHIWENNTYEGQERHVHDLIYSLTSKEPTNHRYDREVVRRYKNSPHYTDHHRPLAETLQTSRARNTMVLDAMFIAGVGCQIDLHPAHHEHLWSHFLEIENQTCASYWIVLALVILGCFLFLHSLCLFFKTSDCWPYVTRGNGYQELVNTRRVEYGNRCRTNHFRDCYVPELQHYFAQTNFGRPEQTEMQTMPGSAKIVLTSED